MPLANANDRLVFEVMTAYKQFAIGYKGGSGDDDDMLRALEPLRALYGRARLRTDPLEVSDQQHPKMSRQHLDHATFEDGSAGRTSIAQL
jgi:hypothetical protein